MYEDIKNIEEFFQNQKIILVQMILVRFIVQLQKTNQAMNQQLHHASITEHDVSDTELNTGENLIIDENIKNEHKHEHPLSCSCTKTQTLNNTQNPDNKNEKLQQEAETNNKTLPFNI